MAKVLPLHGARHLRGHRALTGSVSVGSRRWIDGLGRVGLGARAAIYLLLGYLAFDIAGHGSAPVQPNSSGALQEAARHPGGVWIMAILGVGLAAYGLWRLAAASGRAAQAGSKDGVFKRIGALATAIVYFLLCWQAFALATGTHSPSASGGAASHPSPTVATVLAWPQGQLIVGLVGAAIAITGLSLAIWGVVHDYDKNLDTNRLHRRGRLVARTTGIAGEVTRGLWILLVSSYFISAARSNDAKHAKGLGTALQSLSHGSGGRAAIAVGAVGLVAFGIFSAIEAVYRRL